MISPSLTAFFPAITSLLVIRLQFIAENLCVPSGRCDGERSKMDGLINSAFVNIGSTKIDAGGGSRSIENDYDPSVESEHLASVLIRRQSATSRRNKRALPCTIQPRPIGARLDCGLR